MIQILEPISAMITQSMIPSGTISNANVNGGTMNKIATRITSITRKTHIVLFLKTPTENTDLL